MNWAALNKTLYYFVYLFCKFDASSCGLCIFYVSREICIYIEYLTVRLEIPLKPIVAPAFSIPCGSWHEIQYECFVVSTVNNWYCCPMCSKWYRPSTYGCSSDQVMSFFPPWIWEGFKGEENKRERVIKGVCLPEHQCPGAAVWGAGCWITATSRHLVNPVSWAPQFNIKFSFWSLLLQSQNFRKNEQYFLDEDPGWTTSFLKQIK